MKRLNEQWKFAHFASLLKKAPGTFKMIGAMVIFQVPDRKPTQVFVRLSLLSFSLGIDEFTLAGRAESKTLRP